MFGQQTSTPFGSPPASNPTPFGAQTNTTPAFGGGSTFAASTTQPASGGFGGFGTPAPAPSGFGGFGSTAPAPSGFGAGGFGTPAPAPTGGFGSTTTSSTPFGAPAPSGGLFGAGAPAPSSGGLFGSGSTGTGGFGSTTAPAPGGFGGFGSTTSTTTTGGPFGTSSTGAFGVPAPAPGLFGTPAPAPSAFGSTPAPSAFGAPAPAPLFGGGAPAAAPSTGVFGSPAAPGAAGGTKIAPYQVTNRVDGASSMSLQAITAMSQYENKSFEELRFEDYSQGNKGDGGGASSGGFGFGAPAPATTGFGAPAPATGGLFGSASTPAPGVFGGTGGFGAPAPAPSTFGAPAASAFGSTAAPAPGGFGFGSTTPAPAPGGFGGFGAAKAPAPLFGGGAPAPAPTGGLFGSSSAAPAPSTGGLFGSSTPAPAPGLFGQTPAPAPLFGGPAPAPSGGLFGSTQPAPAPFGSTQPAPAPSTGLFGAPAPAPTGLFGAPAPAGGGLFGAPSPAPTGGGLFGAAKPPGTSLFGMPAPAPGGLFSSPATPAPAGTGLFGATQPTAAAPYAIAGAAPVSVIPPTADALLAQQLAAVDNQRKELEKLEVWRGRSPQGSSVVPQSLSESEARLSSYSATSMGLTSYRASPKSSARIRPRGFGPAKTNAPAPSLGTLGKGGSPMMSPDAYVGSSVKRLVIKPDALTPEPSQRLLLMDSSFDAARIAGRFPQSAASPMVNNNVASPDVPAVGGTKASPPAASPPSNERDIHVNTPVPQNGDTGARSRAGASEESPSVSSNRAGTPTNSYAYDFYKRVVSPGEKHATESPAASSETNGNKRESFAPKLTKEGYTILPSREDLAAMSEAELATVTGFTIEREGFGSVAWDGAVDVRNVDLDNVVSIEERDVAVYDADEAKGTKPPVGLKLNRPAVITMYKVYSKHGPNADAEVKEKFARKITKQTAKMGAELIKYDPENGEWKFRVSHFSRYAFDDDSETTDEEVVADMAIEGEANQAGFNNQAHFELGERGGRPPSGPEGALTVVDKEVSLFNAPLTADDSMSEKEDDIVALVSDAESSDAKVLQAAEDAYAMFLDLGLKDQTDLGESIDTPDARASEMKFFPDEGVSYSEYGGEDRVVPSGEVSCVAKNSGICSKLARKCGIKSETSSSTDYGMRMGRSFRVGWRPDGSFLQLRPASKEEKSGVLVVNRPLFAEEDDDAAAVSSSALKTHLHHSSKDSTAIEGCPVFSLPKTVDALGGTPSSHIAWCNALTGYVQTYSSMNTNAAADREQTQVASRAFSLLMCLYGLDKTGVSEESAGSGSFFSRRRVEAFSNWLEGACAYDVQLDVRSSEAKHDTQSAILMALTGGDILQACQIATKHGYLHLSAMLSSGLSGKDDLGEQVQRWHESGAASHMPGSLLRIYTLLSGDLELEENLYSRSGGLSVEGSLDWRRRLAMRMFHGSSSKPEQNRISSLVHEYDADVASEVAPYPSPRYVTNGSHETTDRKQCVLYRLLHLYADSGGTSHDSVPWSLSNLISPAGYTASPQNLSLAFHLAAVLSAIECCRPLSPFEKATLIDSYAAQLVNAGMWEWALYVFLCLIGDASQEELQWRKQQAKNVVLQHFCGSNSVAKRRRSFLEQEVGVPSAWFEEALSDRCSYGGDVHGYVLHLSLFSPERARLAFEDLMLPNLLFVRRSEGSLNLLGLFGSEDGTLSAAVFDLFRLSEEVQRLAEADPKEGKERASELLEDAASVQATLKAYSTDEERGSSPTRALQMYPGYRIVPQDSFFAEALAVISLLSFQLKALEAGISIRDDQRGRGKMNVVQLKVASQLAYLSASQSIAMESGPSSECILKSLI